MYLLLAFFAGLLLYGVSRVVFTAFYTVRPDERAVLTTLGARHGVLRIRPARARS